VGCAQPRRSPATSPAQYPAKGRIARLVRNAFAAASANDRYAQTFTAQNTGNLTSGQFVVNKAVVGGDWMMQLLATDGAGNATNTVLASTTIPDATVFVGTQTITGQFATPASVTTGQTYALLITRSSSFDLRAGAPCPGQAFYSPSGTISWLGQEFFDLRFAVFVEPPAEPGPGGEPQKAARTLTLDASKNKVKKGKKVTLSGRLDAPGNEAACESGQAVELQRKTPSQTVFTAVEQLQTTATGSFSTKEKVKKTLEYRAEVVESAECQSGVSNTEKVKVKKRK
jgi:hypothetical protein